MSSDPFDELPDQIREAIREMMKKLQEIDPEELENMMEQVFGREFLEKMQDMQFSEGNFGFSLDPQAAKNFEGMMRNFMNQSNTTPQSTQDEISVEEPYYEITPVVDNEGQIVVDLPGITDVRQVKWERTEAGLELSATSDDAKYEIEIPLAKKFKLKDVFAEIKNSVFILPYKSDE